MPEEEEKGKEAKGGAKGAKGAKPTPRDKGKPGKAEDKGKPGKGDRKNSRGGKTQERLWYFDVYKWFERSKGDKKIMRTLKPGPPPVQLIPSEDTKQGGWESFMVIRCDDRNECFLWGFTMYQRNDIHHMINQSGAGLV